MSSAPRTTRLSTSLVFRPASSSAALIASSSKASEFSPTWPSRPLPVPMMAYLSRNGCIAVLLVRFRLAELQPFQPVQHFAHVWHFVDIVDQNEGHAVE